MNVRREWIQALIGAASAAWLLCLVVGAAMALSGCAFVEDMMTRQSTEPPKIFLDRDEIRVGSRSRETDFGVSISEYTCRELLMVCEGFGGYFYCRCVPR